MAISETLKGKIKIHLKERQFEDIIISWILNGNSNEKKYTFDVIKNLKYVVNNFNIIKKKEHKDYKTTEELCEEIKNNLFKKLLDSLEGEKYGLHNNNMEIINTRSWMITILCLCCDSDNLEKCLLLIEKCMEDKVDKYTKYFSLEGIIKCLNYNIDNYKEGINNLFNKVKILKENDEIGNLPRYKWLYMIWEIENSKDKEDTQQIVDYKLHISNSLEMEFINKDENIETVSNILYCLGSYPVKRYIKPIICLLENILKQEDKIKFKRYHIIYYHNIVRCCIGIRFIEDENLNNDKELIHILLFRLLKVLRNYEDQVWNIVKKELLRCFRKYHEILNKKIVIDDLYYELLHNDKNIVTEACKTLHSFYDSKNCTRIIISALDSEIDRNGQEYSNDTIITLSSSLKWMNNNNKDHSVLECLEENMHIGDTDVIRNISRRLISEMGGSNAIKKLDFRNNLKDNYASRIDKAQNKVEDMFTNTIMDAKLGFKITLLMDCIIFFIGVGLIVTTGIMAILDNDTENWVGLGISGGTGVLTILYSLFLSKPREKVKSSVTHLMYLKIIFLGYLRELNQIDQCFNQNLLESDIISPENMNIYFKNIDKVMYTCVYLLKKLKSDSDILPEMEEEQENIEIKYMSNKDLIQFFENNNNQQALNKIRENNIDGEIINNMNREDLIEIGIECPVQRAKLQKGIRNIIEV